MPISVISPIRSIAGLEGSDWTLVFALRIASLILRNRADMKVSVLNR